MAPWTKPRHGAQQSASPGGDLITRIHNVSLETPSTLPAAFNLSNVSSRVDARETAADYQSSSESETELPPASTTNSANRRPQHTRSMSHPFPALFGSKKRSTNESVEPTASAIDRPSGTSTMPRAGPISRTHKRNGGDGPSAGSKDFATGNCMTCASLVRWPKDLKVFKCTICATINDVIPRDDESKNTEPAASRRDTNSRPQPSQSDAIKAPQRISYDTSKQIVDQCIRTYLLRKLKDSPPDSLDLRATDRRRAPSFNQNVSIANPESTVPNDCKGWPSDTVTSLDMPTAQYAFHEQPTLRPSPSKRASFNSRSYSSSYPERPTLQGHRPGASRATARSDASVSTDDQPKRIFKQLEDYIVSCFSSFGCINSSFQKQYRNRSMRAAEGSRPQYGRNTAEQPLSQASRSGQQTSEQQPPQASDVPFEIDPKLLLVGDFAENGTWWTADQSQQQPLKLPQDHPAANLDQLVSSKSPQMNWGELEKWYMLVVNAAEGWFVVFQDLSQDPDLRNLTEHDLRAIEKDFLTAQTHLQRVLMKAVEVLLKRPGRPLTHPVDLRFLLITLENPLLDPGYESFKGLLQEDEDERTPQNRSNSSKLVSDSSRLSGRHSGIVKRLIGLISNSSPRCHNELISWLSRYQVKRFLHLKELVSGFLTYRMLRQSGKEHDEVVDVTAGLIPEMQAGRSGAYLHDEIGASRSSKKGKEPSKKIPYADDWQIKAASRVLALIFAANNLPSMRRGEDLVQVLQDPQSTSLRNRLRGSGQLLPTTDFYNSMTDYVDLVEDFESWESKRGKFCFCQYPFLMSIWAKKQILEHDAHRQMQIKARDAFFDSIMTRKKVNQFFVLDVRRDCLVDDSLQSVSEVLGSGGEDLKKGLRVSFTGEEGIDGGGLRKEWFLLLIREVFNPDHGMFVYDEDSQYCYFNPNSFETSDQFFLVGVVMGLAIYNSTILDVALPPFAFRKLLAAAPTQGLAASAHPKPIMKYTLNDLTEYRPSLGRGLRQLLEYDGDVQNDFCLNFVVEVDKYGTTLTVPLCSGGENRAVTNKNRKEYVDLYVRYMLDQAVTRQFEPFKRGFYTVCGGNAFSLFRPEEVELLVRGSDEPLDIDSLRGVAQYDNWDSKKPDGTEPVIEWFWDTFEAASPSDQRRLLLFVTGSDRIPAMGATALTIKLSCLGEDCERFPIARTCFNVLSLWRYITREKLEEKLWRAVRESEGFGLK